jgi:hypothetical protein
VEPLSPLVAGALARLDERIAALETRGPGGQAEATTTPRSVVWSDLDERATRTEWRLLGNWVDTLLSRHPMHRRALRPCWRAHTDVVDELCALRVAWQAAYRSPDPYPTAAVDWMTRWLPATMARIDHEFTHTGCKAGSQPEHNDPDAHPIAAWDNERIERFITENLNARAAAQ